MSTLAPFLGLGLVGQFQPSNIPTYWFVLPLVVAMSCVYAASRHESPRRIAGQSIRLTGMILGVLVLAMSLLLLINTQV